MTHNLNIHYTMDDDGIWLMCSCGFEFNCGHFPSIDYLTDEANAHIERHTSV